LKVLVQHNMHKKQLVIVWKELLIALILCKIGEVRDKYEDRIYSRLIGADYQILSFDKCSDYRLMR
jgi:hypothetical protein